MMMFIVSLTELILYICFSVIVGTSILLLIPDNKKPPLKINKKLLYTAVGLIPLTALLPVISTAEILNGDQNFLFIFKSILLTFEVGKSWLFILVITTILIRVLITKSFASDKRLIGLALFLTLLMLLGYTKSSHAATITEWQGFLFHSLHFLAVTVWIGILFVVSWFAVSKENWMPFLKWFTPTSIVCLVVTIVAGYFTMGIDINSYNNPDASILQEYQNSLVVNYGQALLFKHIFIISLIIFAVINGILFRKKYNQESFNPLKWARLESIYAFVVFGLTAFMGQSWPPHQLYSLIKAYGASPIFTTIYDGEFISTIQNAEKTGIYNVMISFGLESYLLFLIGVLFMIITILAAVKRHSVFVSSISSLLMVLTVYFGIMLGIQ
ncbi:copper resistance D family protein [Radiobacillus sp. PE A8.2]|uniref:copper resistance D family protein n=1 Tax=Radiobacillus sp. PE A8.2 TaxID=3380349 RepID=UPI00388F0DF2